MSAGYCERESVSESPLGPDIGDAPAMIALAAKIAPDSATKSPSGK